ncbi:hypothetical protein [Nonomuraea endophytica]|uniref:Uncharacterized protein n=1 Tax=Nonomuraea endophytica TaxID=714136 RepID=A0A7W8A886_9ACTN|nr:hypothetical protein [Nonomuraea endophytica]MBB5080540.1 hypothetical protein [Nonomuraea endophytica]
MPERARSLAEGYVYLDLAVPEGGETSEPVAGEDAWTLRLGTIEVEVSYEGERAARRHEMRFGPGISRLVDAGQWVVVAGVYAHRALAEDLEFAADPTAGDDAYESVVAGWELAADAVAEALRFVPAGADRVPADAFWTHTGRAVHRENPERFTRQALEADLAHYRQNLDDFQRLHDTG